MKKFHAIFFLILFSCRVFVDTATANVGAIAGSIIFSINAGSASNPTYKIVSASTVGEAVYSGVVDSYDDTNDRISFATTLDESNTTVYPFFASGAFNKDAQVPVLTPTVVGSAVTALSVSYGSDGYQSSRTGFSNAPEIVISSGEGSVATATCTISNGEITGCTVTDGGSGYSNVPEATVIGGPHLVKITDTSSNYYGRVFLITDNTQTTLDLDFSIVADGETAEPSTFFPAGTTVEVVPAATLGNIFGIAASALPANWSTASDLYDSSTSDWVYIWDASLGGYASHHFVNGNSWLADGWYGTSTGARSKNNLVIYPDESFIVAKRSSGNVELEVEGAVSTKDQKLYLPATQDQMLCNNPYGMELFLAELIPSTSIGSSGNTKFRAGSSNSDTDADYVTFLSGSTWKKFWYKEGVNDAVSELMRAKAKAGTAGSNGLSSSDLFIGSGTITNLQSCSDAAGSSLVTNYNDGNYTKISITGSAPSTGFVVEISDVQGYMLSEDGLNEVNATTGESVETNGTGSVVYSNISGSFEVVGSGSGYIVVEKQRDVNFKSSEGSPAWAIGDLGTGYSQSAQWWAIGGGGSGASGTVSTSGSFTVTTAGSGYNSAPQIVISGGGWRYQDDSPRGNESLGASDGIIISRRATGGVKAFIAATNPSNN